MGKKKAPIDNSKKGWKKTPWYTINPFRYTASDMQELVWDEELAHGARVWAEQCDFNHDSNDVCIQVHCLWHAGAGVGRGAGPWSEGLGGAVWLQPW